MGKEIGGKELGDYSRGVGREFLGSRRTRKMKLDVRRVEWAVSTRRLLLVCRKRCKPPKDPRGQISRFAQWAAKLLLGVAAPKGEGA